MLIFNFHWSVCFDLFEFVTIRTWGLGGREQKAKGWAWSDENAPWFRDWGNEETK